MTEDMKNRLDRVMDYCQTQSNIYNNFQLGSKVIINGIYGSFGFSAFYFYNKDIAEAVTKQGKHAILRAERYINLWAKKVWLKDEKTHKRMGINIKPKSVIDCNSTVYIDTDSIYTSFDNIIKTTDWFDFQVWRLTKVDKKTDLKSFVYVSSSRYPSLTEAMEYFEVDKIDETQYSYTIDQIEPSGREFCLTLDRVFMHDFLVKIHDDYAKENGTPNILDFELEAYNEAGIWLAKKKYIKNMTWAEPNVYYEPCTKIKATGVEIAQTSSSVWVKKQLVNLVQWIFKQEEFVFKKFVDQVTEVKKQFMNQNVETISVNKGMSKYGSYVLNDTDCVELQPKSMVTVQGAALYNWMLNNNEKYKRKYSMLSDSDKLCVVYIKPTKRYGYWKRESMVKVKDYAKNPDGYKLITNNKQTYSKNYETYEYYTDALSWTLCEAFSYPPGFFPMDMADGFEVDYDRMFDLLILGPINRIVVAMGYPEISIGMTFDVPLW